jgi:hypothetical protein
MEIPRSAARELTSVADMAMSAIVKSSPRRLSATRLRRRRRHPERHCHGNPGWRLGWDEIGGMKPPPDPGYRHLPAPLFGGWLVRNLHTRKGIAECKTGYAGQR